MNTELTTQEFWDSYWANLKLPSVINEDFSFERCLANFLRDNSNMIAKKGKVLEVGAAPGKWLAFIDSIGIYTVSGIEYSRPGADFLRKNLDLLKLNVDTIFNGDFFEITPVPEYDIVMSYGFIEHFADPDKVVEKHIEWLKTGGTLILGIPNFKSAHGWVQRIFKREILDIHNLNIMRDTYFQEVSKKLRISLKKVEYIGGFEPDLIICDPNLSIKNFIPRIALRILKTLRKLKFFDRYNNRIVSSYIIAIFEK